MGAVRRRSRVDCARDIREYFIPDFSNWKDHDSYQKAFERLVRDLKRHATWRLVNGRQRGCAKALRNGDDAMKRVGCPDWVWQNKIVLARCQKTHSSPRRATFRYAHLNGAATTNP